MVSTAVPEWAELAGLIPGWSAVENERVGPWTVRASDGFSRWANSVLILGSRPLQSDADPVVVEDPERQIEQVEAFYSTRQLPSRFRLCGPLAENFADHAESRVVEEALIAALLRRGYEGHANPAGDARSWVAELRPLRASAPVERFGRVRIEPEPGDAWLERWWEWLRCPDSQRSGAMELVSMLHRHVGFAAHVNGPDLLALGIGVIEGPWLALHHLLPAPGLAAMPDAHNHGSLRRVISALATWGIAHAAQRAHLEVPSADTVTTELLTAIGFRPVAQVRYFERIA